MTVFFSCIKLVYEIQLIGSTVYTSSVQARKLTDVHGTHMRINVYDLWCYIQLLKKKWRLFSDGHLFLWENGFVPAQLRSWLSARDHSLLKGATWKRSLFRMPTSAYWENMWPETKSTSGEVSQQENESVSGDTNFMFAAENNWLV